MSGVRSGVGNVVGGVGNVLRQNVVRPIVHARQNINLSRAQARLSKSRAGLQDILNKYKIRDPSVQPSVAPKSRQLAGGTPRAQRQRQFVVDPKGTATEVQIGGPRHNLPKAQTESQYPSIGKSGQKKPPRRRNYKPPAEEMGTKPLIGPLGKGIMLAGGAAALYGAGTAAAKRSQQPLAPAEAIPPGY